ncbi:MAG: ATP-binding protein [Gammaproteobacteria bacterium]
MFIEAKEACKSLLSGDSLESRQAARETVHRLTIEPLESPITISDKLAFAISCDVSDRVMRGYATLNDDHSAEIDQLIYSIESYSKDASQRRPLNFLMLASPGAGKSHFIKCIANRLDHRRVRAHTFNMASMTTSDELVRPLDEARNAKVEDKLPLLFLDEFDASPSHYGLLLPLLWDGELSVGQRDLKLGKIVIVLAGSSPSLPEALEHAKSMRSEIPLPHGTNPKLIDLFSRINGSVVRIPPFHDSARQIDRRTDKVMVATQLLKHRFENRVAMVPLSLLRFIAHACFRYDVRSIAHLIDLIPRENASLHMSRVDLPLGSTDDLRKSSLAYHVVDDKDQAYGVVDLWNSVSSMEDTVPIGPIARMPFRHGLDDPLRDYRLSSALEQIKNIEAYKHYN